MHHIQYYREQIETTVRRLQAIVLEKNGLPEQPTHAAQIRHLPVYEDDLGYSLLDHTREIMQVEIAWSPIAAEGLFAYIKRYDEDGNHQARIVVAKTDNYCEARYFVAKEIMHCHQTDTGASATNSYADLQQLMQSLVANVAGDSPQALVDQLAHWGAMNFFIPEGWIPLLKKIQAELSSDPNSGEKANLHVATLLRCPEWVVDLKLSS
ncbi:MAG: hypothetical protein RLZZ123_394 [Pseudomonadota bacterium]